MYIQYELFVLSRLLASQRQQNGTGSMTAFVRSQLVDWIQKGRVIFLIKDQCFEFPSVSHYCLGDRKGMLVLQRNPVPIIPKGCLVEQLNSTGNYKRRCQAPLSLHLCNLSISNCATFYLSWSASGFNQVGTKVRFNFLVYPRLIQTCFNELTVLASTT